ncbi:hypothetical protein DH2020_037841 [Rehmannia glutinosa]|uniref:MACPF domain-containing protein n=1 Tax=Rehmannia glutinosa TaxID=99300 RepID=A0ABR0V095_REHGL
MAGNSSKMETALRLRAAAEEAVQSIGQGYDLTLDLRLKYCKNQRITKEGSRLITMDDDHVRDIAIPGGILVQDVPKSINCDKGERMRFSSDVLSFQQKKMRHFLWDSADGDNHIHFVAWDEVIRPKEVGGFGIGNICLKNKVLLGKRWWRFQVEGDALWCSMSEQFNQELSLSGKIPSGNFNAAFEFSGSWQKDAAFTKSLAFDGVFITLYSIALEKSQVTLRDHVKQAVPSSWDPAALARFIEKFGTHVIVGVKMGGKDVIYVKQQHSSPVQSIDVQKRLKDVADKRFSESSGQSGLHPEKAYGGEMEITFFWRRTGGSSMRTMPHNDWCQTVQLEPEVISMSFVPISSLLSGIDGSGFLGHAINLYLRYKPPIEELHQFLEFQLPRQWAPVFGDVPLGPDRKQHGGASLQFSLMGPKLYVNTDEVDVGNKPVTGLRLYLEGKRSNCLAIHLQHLSSSPKTFQFHNETSGKNSNSYERKYYEKVKWKSFSHVCTAPVESDDDLSIVTGAHFEVNESGMKNVLFMRLHFSRLIGATVVKKPEWDGSPALAQKSGIISSIISGHFSTGQKPPPKPSDVNINSALYPEGPPMPAQTRKLLRFVDPMEMMRGPQDTPGYWVVSGARLVVDKGKISLRVKYSLLAVVSPDEEVLLHG